MDENETTPAPLSGRRAEATRNDQRILDAAREVFVADSGAPIAAVAKRAGVGIGALYRRYASKEVLLQRLAAEGLQQYIAAVEDALAQDDGDPRSSTCVCSSAPRPRALSGQASRLWTSACCSSS